MSVQPPVQPAQNGSDERTWGMLCHLLALSGCIVPFGNIIGPLIIWLMKKDQYPFVNEHGMESLNFQISMLIYMAVSAVLIFAAIGFLLLPALGIMNLVLVIMATIAANEGRPYKYPLTIRFIK